MKYPSQEQTLQQLITEQNIPAVFDTATQCEHAPECFRYDTEEFVKQKSSRLPERTCLYKSATRFMYYCENVGFALTWATLPLKEFEGFTKIKSMKPLELFLNNGWLVLTKGLSPDDEIDNYTADMPLKKIKKSLRRHAIKFKLTSIGHHQTATE